MSEIMDRLNKINTRLSEDAFLSNKGLSNEVGIHVFCYDPVDEIINNTWIKNRRAVFTRLVDYKDYAQKEAEFFNSNNRYVQNTSVFNEIPGFTYAYWVGDSFVSNFKTGNSIEAFGEFTGSQNITGNNDKYLRYFWEVNAEDINTSHWVFYAKGGDYSMSARPKDESFLHLE